MKVDIKEFRLKLYPHDFYKVRAFYENDLGLQVTDEWDRDDNHKGVMFSTGSATLELLSPEDGYRPPQGVDVSWEVSNIHELWQDWCGKPNVIFDLRDNEWGDSSFCISDPEGFRITIFTKH